MGPGSISISLGNNTDIGITAEGKLKIKHFTRNSGPEFIDLGRATKARINHLISYLEQLRTHHIA